MAFATCRKCHCGANASTCPSCGGVMISDEEFSGDEGGANPQMAPRKRPEPSRPSFFTIEDQMKNWLRAEQAAGRMPCYKKG